MALFILTIGCTVQRVNWSNVKGEMDHENQISSSSMNKEKHKEQSNHIFGHILNQAQTVFVNLYNLQFLSLTVAQTEAQNNKLITIRVLAGVPLP